MVESISTIVQRVIDGNGDIIPGLLAAGEVAGGLHGNNRIGGNSIAETVISVYKLDAKHFRKITNKG